MEISNDEGGEEERNRHVHDDTVRRCHCQYLPIGQFYDFVLPAYSAT
jgi:hypothetical protein